MLKFMAELRKFFYSLTQGLTKKIDDSVQDCGISIDNALEIPALH